MWFLWFRPVPDVLVWAIADLLRLSYTVFYRVYTKNTNPLSNSCVNVKTPCWWVQWRITRPIWAYRNAMVTQTASLYNCDEQKSILECTTWCILKWMDRTAVDHIHMTGLLDNCINEVYRYTQLDSVICKLFLKITQLAISVNILLARFQSFSQIIWFFCEIIQLCWKMLCALNHRCFFCSTVGQGHAIGCLLGLSLQTASAKPLKGGAELLWHGIIDNRIDGTVQVHTGATEQQEPSVQVSLLEERVDHHQSAVRHPEHGKQNHHHCQHLYHLTQDKTTWLPYSMHTRQTSGYTNKRVFLEFSRLWILQQFYMESSLVEKCCFLKIKKKSA